MLFTYSFHDDDDDDDLCSHIWMRPCHGHAWPLGCASWPDTVAFEGRSDLDDILLTDPDLHLTSIVHHLDTVPIAALITSLGHQCLESATDFPCGQVSAGGDELHPE